jgi:hypothetical protein
MLGRSVLIMTEWLRRVDVQGILGISPSALTRMIEAGRLQPYYRGADPRIPWFRRRDVEALNIPQPRKTLART